MPHQVLVNKANTMLPDGIMYAVNSVVVLTDDQYNQLGFSIFSDGTLTDQGYVTTGTTTTQGPATTQRVSAGYVSTGQSAKCYTGNVALSASATTTVTLETVTAGKTYVITDLSFTASNASVFEVRIQAAGTDIFRAYCKGDTGPVEFPGIETQPVATAGQSVTLLFPITATPPNVSYYIGGIEQ